MQLPVVASSPAPLGSLAPLASAGGGEPGVLVRVMLLLVADTVFADNQHKPFVVTAFMRSRRRTR